MKNPLIVTIALLCLALFAHAQTSNDNPRLKEALKRFPEADTNKDGVPALEEAKAFQAKEGKPDPQDGGGRGIKNSYVYKTVGKEKLELFVDTPKGHTANAKVPAIVFFNGCKEQSKYLAERGMVGIPVNLRLKKGSEQAFLDGNEDAIAAMRWVQANAAKLGVDPDRIAASGGSKGGYKAIVTALDSFMNAKPDPTAVSAKPNALVLFNPGIGGREKNGQPDPRDPEDKANLRNYVTPGMPPAIILHGKADVTVPFTTVEEFTALMKKAGNRGELYGYEGAGHSFFNEGKYFDLTMAETDKFLVGLGWLKKQATAR